MKLARRSSYKVIEAITQIDLQDSGASGTVQDPADDEFGLRDFSSTTLAQRRAHGHARARSKLVPLFETHGLVEPTSCQPMRAA